MKVVDESSSIVYCFTLCDCVLELLDACVKQMEVYM